MLLRLHMPYGTMVLPGGSADAAITAKGLMPGKGLNRVRGRLWALGGWRCFENTDI